MLGRDKSFYEQMDAAGSDSRWIAINLFRGDGHLEEKWISDPLLKGLGGWTSEELDMKDFLVISPLRVENGFRRKGIGKALMNVLFRWVSEKGVEIAFYRPTPLKLVEPIAQASLPSTDLDLDAMRTVSLSFCRVVGFQRVGSSDWFARSTVPGSLASSAKEDTDPVEEGTPAGEATNTTRL